MLGRYVEKKMEEKGELYPFEYVKEFLASSTYVVVNLEGTIPKVHVPTPSQHFQFSFKEGVAPLLSKMHISAVSLANNHGTDWGRDGWSNTKKVLDTSRIRSFGYAQKVLDDVYETSIDGQMVTVFGINMVANVWNEVEVMNTVKALHSTHPDSHLVAFLHWGEEYFHKQNDKQERFAHVLIDNGVDVIIGSHPHVIQGIEIYKNKPIFYSLGNFIFDQYFSSDVQEGYGVIMKSNKNEMTFDMIPYTSEVSQPRIANEENKKIILNKIADFSSFNINEQIKSGRIYIKK